MKNKETKKNKVKIIGLGGGTSSGKSSIAKKLAELFNGSNSIIVVSQDSFYKTPDPNIFDPESKDLKKLWPSTYNFDHPDAFDEDLMISFFIAVKNGNGFDIPIYDYVNHRRSDKTQYIAPADLYIFEGILALHYKNVYDLFDMRLFVEVDDDIRLSRRIRRDIKERGRDLEGVLTQYEKTVKSSHDLFVEPSKKNADLIIPKGSQNFIAITTIASYIKFNMLIN